MNVNGSLKIVCFCAVLLSSYTANAGDFSFTGNFTDDDDVQLFNFTVGADSDVILRTYSYAGGTNAAGDVIAAGGFDPILAVFDSAGLYIADNDDGETPDVGLDPVTESAYDTYLAVTLAAGDYTVAVSQYDNFFNNEDANLGDHISLGFSYAGNPIFTREFNDVDHGMFWDDIGDQRTSFWAFDILNVGEADLGDVIGGGAGGEPIPEPGTLALLGLGAAAAGVAKRRRQKRAAA